MNHPTLIGITGAAGVGKDTLGSMLVSECCYTRLSFAHPIREFVAGLLGITVAEMGPIKEVPQEILGGQTPRWAMQSLGTEWGRDMIAPDLWVRTAMGRADRIRKQGRSVVITDVRFTNEAQAIRDSGGLIVRVRRPDNELASATARHVSEHGLPRDLIDLNVVNNGSPEDLLNRVVVKILAWSRENKPVATTG